MNHTDYVTLVNIPTEILEQILDNFDASLDTHSLLSLGRVNHLFNRLALKRLISPSVLNDIFLRSELIFHNHAPIYMAEVLSIALWIPSVATIKYSASRRNIHHFLSDIRGLSLLLSRIPSGSLYVLELDVSISFSPMSDFFYDQMYLQHPILVWNNSLARLSPMSDFLYDRMDVQHPALVWNNSLARLADTALAAGCRQLSIVSDGHYPTFYGPISHPSPTKPPRRLCFSRLFHNFTRLSAGFNLTDKNRKLGCVWNRTTSVPTPNLKMTPPNLDLRDLSLASGHLFISAFRDSTLKLLSRSSQNLRHLTLLTGQTPPEWICGVLVQPIHFPQLETLTLETPPGAPVSLKSLHAFLSNHPTITLLKLDVCVFESSRQSYTVCPPPKGSSLLPNLEVLETFIQPLIWLLSLRKSLTSGCIHGSREGNHAKVLRAIRIYGGICRLDDPPLGEALLLLNGFIPPQAQGSVESSSSLALRTELSGGYITDSRSVFYRKPTVSRITHLTLELDPGPTDIFSNAVDWLAIGFPMLLELVVVGKPFKSQPSNEMLCREIVEKCQRLRKFEFNGEVVTLRR